MSEMTRIEELMALADAAYTSADDLEEFHYKANPFTIKQLVALCRLHVELVKRYRKETPLGCQPYMIAEKADEAIEAFNRFEQGAE